MGCTSSSEEGDGKPQDGQSPDAPPAQRTFSIRDVKAPEKSSLKAKASKSGSAKSRVAVFTPGEMEDIEARQSPLSPVGDIPGIQRTESRTFESGSNENTRSTDGAAPPPCIPDALDVSSPADSMRESSAPVADESVSSGDPTPDAGAGAAEAESANPLDATQ